MQRRKDKTREERNEKGDNREEKDGLDIVHAFQWTKRRKRVVRIMYYVIWCDVM